MKLGISTSNDCVTQKWYTFNKSIYKYRYLIVIYLYINLKYINIEFYTLIDFSLNKLRIVNTS